jgi:hypothetical protein
MGVRPAERLETGIVSGQAACADCKIMGGAVEGGNATSEALSDKIGPIHISTIVTLDEAIAAGAEAEYEDHQVSINFLNAIKSGCIGGWHEPDVDGTITYYCGLGIDR